MQVRALMIKVCCGVMAAALAAAAAAAQGASGDWIYEMHAGETLFSVAQSYLRDADGWQALQRYNGVQRDRKMPAGYKVRIPLAWLKTIPADANVVDVQGQVEIVAGGDNAIRPARPGMRLQSGDRVRTAAGGSLALRLQDGSKVLVHEGTDMILDTAQAYQGTEMLATRLRLSAGRIETEVARQRPPGGQYEVTTPTAHLGVRGTRFRATADSAAQVSRGEVLSGQVAAAGDKSSAAAVIVPAGYGTVVDASRRPSRPVKLLAAPDVTAAATLQERVLMRFKFKPVTSAVSYHAQIAPDADFQRVLADRYFDAPEAKFEGLPDGKYVLRVRAVDAQRLEGEDAHLDFRLKARPEPPFATSPRNGGKLRAETVRFEWTESGEAATYRFQLATDQAFTALVSDASGLTEPRIKAPGQVAPGDYYWRVASIGADGDQGPFGDAQQFMLRPPPANPEPPTIDDANLHFAWSGEPGQVFHLQLAEDPLFANPLAEVDSDKPSATLPRPKPGPYYMRLRATDADGYVGPYTATQRLVVPTPPPPWWTLLVLVPLFL